MIRNVDFVIPKKKFVALIAWIAVFVFFVYCDSYINAGSPGAMVHFASIMTVAVYAMVFIIWYFYTHKIMSLFFVFLVFCFLFNSGQVLLGIFDTNFEGIVNIYFSYSSKLLIKMMIYQSRCVLFFLLGGIVAYREEAYISMNYSNVIKAERDSIRTVDMIFLAVTAVLAAAYLKEVATRGVADYGEYYYGDREGISVPLLFVYHILMYKVLIEHDQDKFSKIVLIINIVISLFMLMVGSRNAVIQIIFGCCFIGFYVKNRSLNMSFGKTLRMGILGVIAVILFTGVQELRQYSLSELTLEKIIEVYSIGFSQSITDSLTQMGGSARCITETMHQIDSGLAQSEPTFLYSALKAVVPAGLLKTMGIQINTSLAAWITEVGGSEFGWGYSIFAEMYYNFLEQGYVFAFFWALAFVKLEQQALILINKNHVIVGCGLIYILAYAIFISRADSLLMTTRTRYLLYLIIIVYMWNNYRTKSCNNIIK